MRLKTFGLLAASLLTLSAQAATEYPAPDIRVLADRVHGGAVNRLSDNGKWAVGYGKSVLDEVYYSFARLYDVENNIVTPLYTEEEGNNIGVITAYDVTDDGQIVVGNYDHKPAIWRASTGKWEIVENKHPWKMGRIERVTPDGRIAIGTIAEKEYMHATVRVWDLSGDTPRDITPDNIPIPYSHEGTLGEYGVEQIYATDLSADGTKFTCLVNFSLGGWAFLYDMTTKTWDGVGSHISINEDGTYSWGPSIGKVRSGCGTSFLPGTNILYGQGTTNTGESGMLWWDVSKDEVTVLPINAGGGDFFGGIMDMTGTVYGSKDYSGPIRDWGFKVGDYWYDIAVVLDQLWGINWEQQYSHDEYGYTGTFLGASPDGLTLLVADYSMSPYNTYVFRLTAPLKDIVKDFDLLGNYSVSPMSGASFAQLKDIRVRFDRPITVLNEYNGVTVYDEDGTAIANSISLSLDPGDSKTLTMTFRNRRLEEGKLYTVVIPAGTVCITGDHDKQNSEIRVTYKGRPAAPVAPISISPADGTEVVQINATSNPVTLRFNSELSVVDGSGMKLYMVNDDNSRDEIATLSGSITGNELSIYPILEQRLAKGTNYEVVIPAGRVADISGADPNEEITIKYTGAYVPEINIVDGVLFEDNFDQGLTNKWMYYNGNVDSEPTDLMQSWGFVNNYPWWTVMESTDALGQSAATHSMFKTPARADSWMVAGPLYIKDETTFLSFNSQNYLEGVADRLKVVAYTTDDVYTSLTQTIVDNMRYYGEVIYDEEQTPGTSEELLAGDWKENIVKLDKFAGKNIYLAFWNDNRNKSAVFVDDVKVAMDVKFALMNITPATMVAKDDVEVKGVLQVMSETETFKGYSIKLLDANDNILSEMSDPNVTASKGWKLEFTMPNKLTTPVGKETRYKISVTMGESTEVNEFSVQNLARQTTKRVVIEEMTGQNCPNCSLGHAAIDWLEKDLPGLVLPIELHTYTGDPWSNARLVSITQNLGLNAAPTAVINRIKGNDGSYLAISPMAISGNNHVYKNAGVWYDYVISELETMAPADIDVTDITYDDETRTYTADINVTYALDMENINHNLLIEICEDGLEGTQDNNRAVYEDPALGDWGKGGIYGQSSVNYTYHNVARNWSGSTFNGTGGLIPVNVEAGKSYPVQMSINVPKGVEPGNTHITAMLIDSQSGKVLNANRMRSADSTAVESVESTPLSVVVKGHTINVLTAGEVEVEVYSVDGMKIASAAGIDTLSCEVNGYRGIAIVMVKSAYGLKPYKVMLR
ncbi:MAG: Ig-like domain-containing protein [Muribaculaceae bacterium]|nr:Ig-like domain-containing protein [Muribaculaceae bacterium]